MAADAKFMKWKKTKILVNRECNEDKEQAIQIRTIVCFVNKFAVREYSWATMQLDKFHWHCHGWCDAAVRAICNELREVDATGAATDTRTITNRCQCIRCANLWKILRRHAEHFFHFFLATRLGNTHPLMSVHWDQWNVKRQKERVKSPCCCYPFPSDAGDIVLRI